MLIDTHCHLNFHAFKKDLDDVVRRAKEAGVEKIIVPGTDIPTSRRAVEIAQKYSGTCFAAVGIHPHHSQDPNLIIDDNVRHQMEELVNARGVVAVGEVGLDYFRYTKTKYENNFITEEIKMKQKELLQMQLELAVIHNKPVVFHCRQAYADMIQTISAFAKASADTSTFSRTHLPQNNYIKPAHPPADGLRGVFHCFSGSTQDLQLILTMGYYVGFDGNITYSETQYSPLVAAAPINRIFLETDAPFLSPVPHRGSRNEPTYLPFVAQAAAEYHTTPLSELIHISTENAQKLFYLS